MRSDARLSVFTLADGTAITTRSTLEARWAIFFSELGLQWKYEPGKFAGYTPDFSVQGLGFVEIKPTIELLIAESAHKMLRASEKYPALPFFAFIGGHVSLDTAVMYSGGKIFAPSYAQIVKMLTDCALPLVTIATSRANEAKLDHFVSVGKIIELSPQPTEAELEAQRKIVRECSEKLARELNR